MVPNRVSNLPFAQVTNAALTLYRFFGIKYIMKNLNMFFVAFVKPARPGLQKKNLLSFDLNIA
jgi:hypothetical protein